MLPLSDGRPSCLIGEGAGVIGLAVESYFEDQGVICEIVCSSAEAMRWLRENTPSIAVLGYMLEDGPCTALAEVLQARGVPFVIYSGFPAEAACSALRGATWITKQARQETLLDAVIGRIASVSDSRSL